MLTSYNKSITVRDALSLGKLKLDAAGIRSSALEARLLLEFAGTIFHQPSSRGLLSVGALAPKSKGAVAIHFSEEESQYGLPRACSASSRNDGSVCSDLTPCVTFFKVAANRK